jgi:type IV secretory pathway VirB2 component (pilin)
MSSLTAVAATIWGLLVEDGSLAVGIIVALGLTWLAATVLPDPQLDQIGWLLLAMLIILVILNLRAAALGARRKISAQS